MEIRTLTQEEDIAYGLLGNVCFAYAPEKDYEEYPKDLDKHTKDWENKLGAFDEKGNLIAALTVIPYNMYFDGQPVKMGGIAGVVTAPESRATGVMSKVFGECLRFMKEKGQIFSVLYPFSYAYYRKFGYETAYQLRNAKIEIRAFCNYPYPKNSVRFWKKGDGYADFKAVYDVFKKSRNYAMDRDDKSWEEIMKDDMYINKRYTYIHYDSSGKPDAYLITKAGDNVHNVGKDVTISELAWTTNEGLYAMFGFIGGLRPTYNNVLWEVPMSLDLYTLFPEAWEISIDTPSSVQTRIMDLESVLKRLRVPSLFNGKVVLDVADRTWPDNTGKYAVSWENGVVSAARTDQKADMATSIEAMAQLAIGYLTPEMAVYRKDTTIYSQHEALSALFPKKDLYLWEKF